MPMEAVLGRAGNGPQESVVSSGESLTVKQQAFCNEYMKDRNVAAAVRRAGYKCSSMGNKLLRNPAVRKELLKREQQAYEDSNVTVAEIVGRLAEIMRFDILDMCDENGMLDLSNMDNIPAHARACIKEFDVKSTMDSDGNPRLSAKIKFYSKLEAADMLMRYFGGYKPEVLQQLVQLDWARLEKRADVTEDDPLAQAIANLDATKEQ